VRAAVLYEPNKPMPIEELSIEKPRDGEVMVRIAATGACHSDYHVMDGSWHGPGYPLPAVLGHEASAIVEEVGPGVRGLERGDHVILSFVPSCGRCRFCTVGQPHLCNGMRGRGGTTWDGSIRLHKGETPIHHFGGGMSSFAELSVVHESQAIKDRKSTRLNSSH